MAPFGSPQTEKAKIEQIVAEYYAKALHIILEARIPHLVGGAGASGGGYGNNGEHEGGYGVIGAGRYATTNKWFNLELESSAHVVESVEPWRRGVCHEPMVVDVWLHQPTTTTGESSSGGNGLLLERQRSLSNNNNNKWSSSPQRVANSRGESWNNNNEAGVVDEASSSSSSSSVSRTLLERWVVHYDRTTTTKKKTSWLGFGATTTTEGVASHLDDDNNIRASSPSSSPSSPSTNHVLERPVVYKRTVIMLRSLYCLIRTLPAFRLFKLATSSSHSRSFSLSYTVSPAPSTLLSQDEGAMMKCNLTPIETQWGRLCIYSMYRNATAVTALEITPRIISRIIPDYVGSPTTDTLRRFTSVGSLPSGGLSGRHGVHVVSLPGSVPNSPSGAFGRRHSWSGGINKVQSNPQTTTPMSPSYKSSSPSPSPSHPSHHDFQNSPPKTSHFGTHAPSNLSPRNSPLQRQFMHPPTSHNNNDSQPIPIHARHSPPFSPSPSPSPPQHGYSRSRSDPVSIPRPTNLNRPLAAAAAPGGTRSPLPPPSPQTRPFEKTVSFNSRLHSQGSGGGGHVSNLSLDSKIAAQSADSSQLISPRSRFRRNQTCGDDQGDELALSGIKRSAYSPPGLVLGGFRATNRVSSHSHEDPEDNLECPFAIDNDESEDYLSRVGSPRPKVPDSPDFQGSTTPGSAVGALVRILKGAAPLRQQSAPPGFTDHLKVTPLAPSSPVRATKHSPPKPNSPGTRNLFRGRSTDFRPTSLGGHGIGGSIAIGSPPSVGVRQASAKSTADALEELRQYREMRDFLVHQSGGKAT